MLYKKLMRLGFSSHESKILSVLYEFSPSGASYLAKKTDLPRSSVYSTIALLIEKGIVGTTYKNEVKQFVVKDLEELHRYLQGKKEKINKKIKLLPEVNEFIKKVQNTSMQLPQIISYEGKEGLKKIYLDMLRNAPKYSTMYIARNDFIWTKEWAFTHEKKWKELSKKLKEKRSIKTKLLINSSKTEKENTKFYKKSKNLEYKFMKKTSSFEDFSLYILGDTISMISLENNNLVGVKIVNLNIANNYKTIFMNMWENN